MADDDKTVYTAESVAEQIEKINAENEARATAEREAAAAKVSELESARAALEADNLALKATNYDLMQSQPVEREQVENIDTPPPLIDSILYGE